MASQAAKHELDLNDPEMAEAWITQLEATARIKKLSVSKDADGERGLTDLFLSKAGLTAHRTLGLMAAPNKLEKMLFADIKALVEVL